jgi:C-terminal processing protease CtpA/Prc
VPEGGERGPITVELTPLAPGEDPRVELTGIGAVLAPRGERLAIVSVLAAGGAAEAGLGAGDEVLRIDGQPVAELSFADAVMLIRGPEGSTVTLGVRKRGAADGQELPVVVYRRLVRN